MQQRVEIRCGVPLVPVAVAAARRVDPRAERQEWHRKGGPRRDSRIQIEQENPDAQHLQRGDEPLLDAVDEDALHVGDILDDPRHDVTGPARVEPLQRQPLDFLIQIRANVVDDLLLEDVVDVDADPIQPVFRQEAQQRDQDPEAEFPVPCRIGNDLVDHMAGRIREHENRQRHPHRAGELGGRQTRVMAQIGKNAEDRFHEFEESDVPV